MPQLSTTNTEQIKYHALHELSHKKPVVIDIKRPVPHLYVLQHRYLIYVIIRNVPILTGSYTGMVLIAIILMYLD